MQHWSVLLLAPVALHPPPTSCSSCPPLPWTRLHLSNTFTISAAVTIGACFLSETWVDLAHLVTHADFFSLSFFFKHICIIIVLVQPRPHKRVTDAQMHDRTRYLQLSPLASTCLAAVLLLLILLVFPHHFQAPVMEKRELTNNVKSILWIRLYRLFKSSLAFFKSFCFRKSTL